MMRVASKNEAMLNAGIKYGFKYVDYVSNNTTNYNSIVLVKWLNGCPIPAIIIERKFKISKIKGFIFFPIKKRLQSIKKQIIKIIKRLRDNKSFA